MKTIFVPDYEWNAHWDSVEMAVASGKEYGEYEEGHEFTMVRLEVYAATTYKIVNGIPVVVSLAFPSAEALG
jgi:hypothetical protein